VSTLIGHSLGGKIALEVARQGAPLSQVWVLDANPGPQAPSSGGEVGRVIAALRKIPLPIETRADIAQLLLDEGLSPAIANWMTTNLERTDGGYGWALDIDGIHALLLDYAASDHWPFLDSRHQDDLDLRIVVAERSDRLDQEARAHFERLASRGQLGYQLLPDAGHWLHVDNPEGLLALLAKNLPTA
jgi:pimeloyl-ACP methyl ester carboxylesterase